MESRPFWKGYLKLSLVTCSVAMTPAISERDKVRFHTLNRATGNRVTSRYADAETGKPVKEADLAKGYPRDGDGFVVLEDDEIDAVALESARTIDISTFVAKDSIDWVWRDRPHYLFPNDAVGAQAFAVIRDAMNATDKVAISRLVLYRRERAVLLEARGKGIVLWTLRYGDEVRAAGDYFRDLDGGAPAPELMRLVTKLIDKDRKPWTPEMASDPVQNRLLEIIAAKERISPGRKASKPKPSPSEGAEIIDLTEALRRSLGAKSVARKR
jgi:DNA end-binding protein Ku